METLNAQFNSVLRKTALLIFISTCTIIGSFAQNHDNPIDSAVRGKFSFSGYIDAYYLRNFNNPNSGNNIGSSGFARAFDQKESQFQIGLVQTKIAYKQRKSEAVADLVFGPNADLGNYGNVVGPLGNGKASSSLAIKQAYFSYYLNDKLTLTVGQFGTHIGYEVIDAPVNYNYSLSNLFNNGPFYHLGFKGVYTFNPKFNVMAGLVNNWDRIYDNNKYSTFISELAFTPKDGYSILINYIGGNEAELDSAKYVKQMIDLTSGFQLTKKYFFGINAVQGIGTSKDETKYWGGIALYSNYSFTEKFGLGVRTEYFDNTQGVQYIGKTDVTSLTLTGKITLADGHLLVKPEIRTDIFKKQNVLNGEQFEDKDGNFTKNQQTTAGIVLCLVLKNVYRFD
ncbi:MAG: hypothetical protein RLZZ175_2190 [Bacteroidota bacterium]|jgi:hypothetical protein